MIYIFNKANVLDAILVLLFVRCCKGEEDEEAQLLNHFVISLTGYLGRFDGYEPIYEISRSCN